jgi:A/G-specific adenine glycosylase
MELGAMVCTPRAPTCDACPLASQCRARPDDPEAYPAAKAKAKTPTVRAVTIVVERAEKLLLVRRPPRGLWGGLWEPPMRELDAGERPAEAAARVVKSCTGLDVADIQALDRFEHVLTHRRMQFHAFRARAPRGRVRLDGYDAARWQPRAGLGALGIAAWTRRILDAHLQEQT